MGAGLGGAAREDAVKAFLDRQPGRSPRSRRTTVLAASLVGLCASWPPTPRPEAVSLPGPDVPVLVLSGRADLRTPLEDARRTALQYPNAQVLAVPGVGHSVLSVGPQRCAVKGTVAFLRGGRCRVLAHLGRRARAEPLGAVRARLDRRPAPDRRLRPPRPHVLRGLRDPRRASATTPRSRVGGRFPGLRAGYVVVDAAKLELHGVEWIRGVRVSGTRHSRGVGTLTVSRPLRRRGHAHVLAHRVTGVLGGQSISRRSRRRGTRPHDQLRGNDRRGRRSFRAPISSSSRCSARRPISLKSWRTVVSGGVKNSASGMSSKPTMLTSSGTLRP